MGAGKTTVGRQLAKSLSMSFADSDHEIQERTGVDVPTIFEYEGEEGFRKRERKVISDLTLVDNQVLASGGGVVIDPINRDHLSSRGFVVYLHCSPQQQFNRTYMDRNRPLLQTEDPLARLEGLFSERDPLYRKTADIVVSAEGRSVAAVTKEIIRRFRENKNTR